MHETPAVQAHRAKAEEKLSSAGRKYFHFIEFDENEELIMEIRKHPFGLFLIMLTGGFIMLVLLLIASLGGAADAGGFLGINVSSYRAVFFVVIFLLILGVAVSTFIGAFLYTSNVIFLTSEKLAQVLYLSLFNRKISQLSIGDVQDVTVTQKGILAHIFNYGTLVVETAGEQQNYTFSFVPDPYQTSKAIVGAHEFNLQKYGN